MSYVAHNWTDGETITAAKLNNIENGIDEASQSGGGAVQVGYTFSDGTFTLDKTWQDVYDGMVAGNTFIVILDPDDFTGWGMSSRVAIITELSEYNSSYSARVGDYMYSAASSTDYLSLYIGD